MRNHLCSLLLLSFIPALSQGQTPPTLIRGTPDRAAFKNRVDGTAVPPSGFDAVQVTRPVRAAFIIDPLVHRVTAPRGKLLRFNFRMTANAKPTRLNIAPVAMVQQLSGAILPDRDAVAPDVLKITSAENVDLALGEEHVIECELRVPPVNSPFLSYGILVRELPRDEPDPDQNSDSPKIGLRFVTQYLLRIDLTVQGVGAGAVGKIELETAKLINKDGNAFIQAFVENPTDASMSFQMRTQLVSRATRKTYRNNLFMPARSGLPVPDRYTARILHRTRLMMVSPLDHSVFPGEYDLHVEVQHNGRTYNRASFPVTIQSGDFPAQDATIVRVARDVAVEPSAVELSLRKGGKRLQSLTLENGSQQTIIAELKPKAAIGDLADWISFRPSHVEIAPGRKRKVLVMLGSKRSFETHNYAYAQLTVRPEIGEAIGSQDIPIALLTKDEAKPVIKAGQLGWTVKSGRGGFEVPIENTGDRHLALNARLSLDDQFGRGFQLEAGYGRWVLPGKTDRLWFRLPQMPPPGIYEVVVDIDQGEDEEPFQLRQNIELRSPAERISEKETPLSR